MADINKDMKQLEILSKQLLKDIEERTDYKHDFSNILVGSFISSALHEAYRSGLNCGADIVRDVWNPKTEEI